MWDGPSNQALQFSQSNCSCILFKCIFLHFIAFCLFLRSVSLTEKLLCAALKIFTFLRKSEISARFQQVGEGHKSLLRLASVRGYMRRCQPAGTAGVRSLLTSLVATANPYWCEQKHKARNCAAQGSHPSSPSCTAVPWLTVLCFRGVCMSEKPHFPQPVELPGLTSYIPPSLCPRSYGSWICKSEAACSIA